MLGCLAFFWLKGCALFQTNLHSLRIGINDWPGYSVVLYGKEKGIFKKRGLEVELIQFNNTQDAIRAVMRGALDLTFVPLWEVMQTDSKEDEPVFFLVVDVSAGSDGIVAQPGIKMVQQLKGKRVGAKLATLNHLVLLEALNAYQLKPQDVIIEDYLNEVSQQQIIKGNLDAAVLWEPFLSQTAEKIKGNIIFTTREIESLVIDGMASREDFIRKNRKQLVQFIVGWFDIIQEIETAPDTVFTAMDQLLEQDRGVFAKDYGGLKKGDWKMNQEMFLTENTLEKSKEQIIDFLRQDTRHGRIVREDVKIDKTLVQEAIARWQP